MSSLIPSGAHVFVDESKSKSYYVAASVIAPADVAGARSATAALRRARQRRVHLKSESDSSRNAFLNGAIHSGLYVARNMLDKIARPLCLVRLLDDLMAAGATKLVLERDESREKAVRPILAQHLKSYGRQVSKPREEPLLLVSDAVAWCHEKCGDWIRKAGPRWFRTSSTATVKQRRPGSSYHPEDCQTHFSGLLPLARPMLPQRECPGIPHVGKLTRFANSLSAHSLVPCPASRCVLLHRPCRLFSWRA